MSRTLSLTLVLTLVLQPMALFAQTVDHGIVDYVDQKDQMTKSPITLDYQSFSSCADMDTTLTDYVKKLIKA